MQLAAKDPLPLEPLFCELKIERRRLSLHVTYSDKELLTRISMGDEQAFGQLFHSWQRRLYGYVLTLIKSPQTAEEVVMDVMTKLWLGRALLPEVEHLDGFLFRIAYRRSIDILRSGARQPQFADLLWEVSETPGTSHADAPIIRKQYEALLQEAISQLSEQRRKV